MRMFIFWLLLGTLALAQSPRETIGAFIHLGGDTNLVYTNDQYGEGASINFGCLDSGDVALIYELAGYMGGDRQDRVMVSYNVDDRGFVDPMMWNLLRGQESAYMPPDRVASFLQVALSGQEVFFGVTDPLDDETRVHGFSLDGFRSALNRLPCYP